MYSFSQENGYSYYSQARKVSHTYSDNDTYEYDVNIHFTITHILHTFTIDIL